MKLKSAPYLPLALILLTTGLYLLPQDIRAQDRKAGLDQTVFSKAAITWDTDTRQPSFIKLDPSVSVDREDFFTNPVHLPHPKFRAVLDRK